MKGLHIKLASKWSCSSDKTTGKSIVVLNCFNYIGPVKLFFSA